MSVAGTGPVQREAFIDGLALWTPRWPGWAWAAPALRGPAAAISRAAGDSADNAAPEPPSAPLARPAPRGLGANERRRAPVSVLVALQVAEQAVAMSGHAAHTLASVFTSAHGDLPVIEALLHTLAREPQALSPTRFHHSVHNAPSGYWGIAQHNHAASTALAAYEASFGAGLLEALVQTAAEEAPVLLAGCDTEAGGPLASVNTSRGLLGVALVLAPRAGPHTRFALRWRLCAEGDADNTGERTLCETHGGTHVGTHGRPPSELARACGQNALADALPMFEALARGGAGSLALRCGPATALCLRLQPYGDAGQAV